MIILRIYGKIARAVTPSFPIPRAYVPGIGFAFVARAKLTSGCRARYSPLASSFRASFATDVNARSRNDNSDEFEESERRR